MGAVQFIENMDRTTLTISDEEFEKNVEAAVSAIAEKHRLESPPTSSTTEHPPMSFPLTGEPSTRPSMDNDAVPQQSYGGTPRRSTSSNDDSGEYDEKAAITGLLRTIQKPLSTIGRMFSDSDDVGGSSSNAARSPAHTPLPPGAEGGPDRRRGGNSGQYSAEESAARQASAEAAEAQRLSRAEHANIVETLKGMFPDLDKDIISDVVYQKEGRYVTGPNSLSVRCMQVCAVVLTFSLIELDWPWMHAWRYQCRSRSRSAAGILSSRPRRCIPLWRAQRVGVAIMMLSVFSSISGIHEISLVLSLLQHLLCVAGRLALWSCSMLSIYKLSS